MRYCLTFRLGLAEHKGALHCGLRFDASDNLGARSCHPACSPSEGT
jgi:hypothetical protein